MNIVFLIRTLTFGGAERQLVALARGLHQRGHRVRVVVFYAGGPLEPEVTAAGIPVLNAGKLGRWDLLSFVWRLTRILRNERPDIVHGYLGASNLLALALRLAHRGRVVWGIRATDIKISPDDWLGRFEVKLAERTSRFANLIITNSYSGKRDVVARGFPPAKTIVIPNGIDVDRFQFDPGGRVSVRAELGLGEGDVLIGRVGRIYPQKDYPTFLRAAALIAESRPRVKFLCAGSGAPALESELKALSARLGLENRVIWSSARPDMPAVYSAMDLSVSSSAFGEGTPNVVAEAMACGVPCVVTDAGDSAMVTGDPGAVVPPGNPRALADAALALLDRIEAGSIDRTALRARIVSSLSLECLIDRSEEALISVIPPATRSRRDVREVGI